MSELGLKKYAVIQIYNSESISLDTVSHVILNVGISCRIIYDWGIQIVIDDGKGIETALLAQEISNALSVSTIMAQGTRGLDCEFRVFRQGTEIAMAEYRNGRRICANGIVELEKAEFLSLAELLFLPDDWEQERTDDWEQLVCKDIFGMELEFPQSPQNGYRLVLDNALSTQQIQVYQWQKIPMSFEEQSCAQHVARFFENAQHLSKIEKISHIPELIPSVCLQLDTRGYFPNYELDRPSYLSRPNYYEIMPDGQMVPAENANPFRKASEQPEEFCVAKTGLIPYYEPIHTALREAGNCRLFGIDKNEQLYAWEQNKGIYIFDKDCTYCNFEAVSGDLIGWYLNAHGDMCLVFTCPEDNGESMDIYRIPCDPQFPEKRLPPVALPREEKDGIRYASVHIRCGNSEQLFPKVLKILHRQQDQTYKVFCKDSGHYLSVYETTGDGSHIAMLAEEFATVFPRTVVATYGTSDEKEKVSIWGKREHIMDVSSDEDIFLRSEKELSLWSEKRLDPWTRKRIKFLSGGFDSYCRALMIYAQFPTQRDLSPHYNFLDTVTTEGNVQIFRAQETDYDERRKQAEVLKKAQGETLLCSADSNAQLVQLSHLKGELEEPIVVGWWYLLPNQKLALYDPKGYLNQRELGTYGIQADGSLAPWEDIMAGKPIFIPNFSVLNRCIHDYQDWFPWEIMILGIDGQDRIYASGKQGIYVMDRDMTKCSFVKCSKMIDGWYLNNAGEFCFFGRNQRIDGGQRPDTWVYKIAVDETQWEDGHEMG